MIVFAQFSDTHLDGRKGRAERAAAVVAYLNGLSMPLDAVVVTGDIADHGLPAEYEQARTILSASRHPVFPCPGNHDTRALYREILLGENGGADAGVPVNRVRHTAGALFALCDSTIPGRDDGYLADETISWLDRVLAERPDVTSFLCFHHPPAPLHVPYVDSIRQLGEHRLPALVARPPQDAATLCGHARRPATTTPPVRAPHGQRERRGRAQAQRELGALADREIGVQREVRVRLIPLGRARDVLVPPERVSVLEEHAVAVERVILHPRAHAAREAVEHVLVLVRYPLPDGHHVARAAVLRVDGAERVVEQHPLVDVGGVRVGPDGEQHAGELEHVVDGAALVGAPVDAGAQTVGGAPGFVGAAAAARAAQVFFSILVIFSGMSFLPLSSGRYGLHGWALIGPLVFHTTSN